MLQSIKPGMFIVHNQSILGIQVCSEQVDTQDDLGI